MRLRVVVLGVNLLILVLVGLALAQSQVLLEYRLGQVEHAVEEVTRQHMWLGALLITNLVAVVVSLVITLVTRKRHR